MGVAYSQIPLDNYVKTTVAYTVLFSSGQLFLQDYSKYNYIELTALVPTTINVTQIWTTPSTSNPFIIKAGANLTINLQGVSAVSVVTPLLVLADLSPLQLEGDKGDWIQFEIINGACFQIDAQTYDSLPVSIPGIGVTDTTYVNFLIDLGMWIPGAFYRITDFATVYQNRNNTDTGWTTAIGPTEPIIVLAIASDKISTLAFQEDWENDIIEYNLNENSFTDFSNIEKGRIIRRHDKIKNIDLPYDWRNYKHKRWETTPGSGLYFMPSYPGGAELSQLFYSVGNLTTGGVCRNIIMNKNSEEWVTANPNSGHTRLCSFVDGTTNVFIDTNSHRIHFSNLLNPNDNIKINGTTVNSRIDGGINLILNNTNDSIYIANSTFCKIDNCQNFIINACNYSTFIRCNTVNLLVNLTNCLIDGYVDAYDINTQLDGEYIKNIRSNLKYTDVAATLITVNILDLTALPFVGELTLTSVSPSSYTINEITGSFAHEIIIKPDVNTILNLTGTSIYSTPTSSELVLANLNTNLIGAGKDWIKLRTLDTPTAWYQIDAQQYL